MLYKHFINFAEEIYEEIEFLNEEIEYEYFSESSPFAPEAANSKGKWNMVLIYIKFML